MTNNTISTNSPACLYPYKRIRVFPDRDLRATILELSMIDTRIMQRLRNTKQLGNSNVSYPTAEHSRFSHSLGVLYWSNKILLALKDNHISKFNTPILNDLNQTVKTYFRKKLPEANQKIFENDNFLGVSWFEQLVRLYALLHDLSHIPFGHTIEDQAELFERHDDDLPRLDFVFKMLSEEVNFSYHIQESTFATDLRQVALEYINLIKSMFVVGNILSEPHENDPNRKKWIDEWNLIDENIREPMVLAYDIVSNTICADLMDYTLRDTLFASMPKTFDKALLTCMKIVKFTTVFYDSKGSGKNTKMMHRLGVSISRKKIRHDIVTAILDLLRIRYDLTEKVYYHHTKVITDAMLEKVLRILKDTNEQFTPNEIYEKYLGDEGFLNLLESKLQSENQSIDLKNAKNILEKSFTRNLYKAVFRINKNESLNKFGRDNLNSCSKPEGRTKMEKAIIEILSSKYNADLENGDILISFPPKKMQKKVAKALIEWMDGQIYTFENLPLEANYSNEVGTLTERYQSLWSMTIYVNPKKIHYVKLIESICEEKFDIHNEAILRNYIRERYAEYYETSNTITDINRKVISIESKFIESQAAKGGTYIDEKVKNEFVENAFQDVANEKINARRAGNKSPNDKNTSNKKSNNDQQLGFEDSK